MLFERKTIRLKDGREAVLRSPKLTDTSEMLEYIKTTSAETHFLLRCPEECTETLDQEQAFLQRMIDSPNSLMIVCELDGSIAGNCQINFKSRLKTSHRASIGIGILKAYWCLGIGTAMFEELIRIAKERGIYQLELEVIDGNVRAIALYRKMGFEIVATKPDAIRLKDGTMLDEHIMIKKL